MLEGIQDVLDDFKKKVIKEAQQNLKTKKKECNGSFIEIN
jgi:hypothetical protein